MRIIPLAFLLLFSACAGEPPANQPPASDSTAVAAGPTGSDIHLFALRSTGAEHLAHVTDRDGYDNQPSFSPDGAEILFTSDREGQMDTFAYHVRDGVTRRVTQTEEGEYSPTVLPDDPTAFSVIRMAMDGTQELWSYPVAGGDGQRLADVDRVGYHTWVGTDRILFFRLGSPPTIQLIQEGTADTSIVAVSGGRSLHRIPGRDASSFMVRESQDYAEIRSYDWTSGETEALAVPVGGGQDYAWTPDGTILMAVDGILYGYAPGIDVDWREIAELGLDGTNRLAVSPAGDLIAVVADRSE